MSEAGEIAVPDVREATNGSFFGMSQNHNLTSKLGHSSGKKGTIAWPTHLTCLKIVSQHLKLAFVNLDLYKQINI